MRYSHLMETCDDRYREGSGTIVCQRPAGHRDQRHVHEVKPDDFYRRTIVTTWANENAEPAPVEFDGPYLVEDE